MAHPHQTRSARRSARLLTCSDDNSLSFDVIQSGPTRTTATLTPTTLRNIEQTFLEVPESSSSAQPQIPHQAGFVPPFIPFQAPQMQTQPQPQQQPQPMYLTAAHLENIHTNSSHSYALDDDDEDEEEMSYTANQAVNSAAVMDDDSMGSDSMSNGSFTSGKTGTSTPPPLGGLNNSGGASGAATGTTGKTPARRGGRRPNKASNLSPEEQEKRCLRRERNKLAAARCRKRRVDHTNELTGEVDGLERKKQVLQNDIKNLQLKKEELEFLLEAHRDHCRLFGRSSSPADVKPQLQQQMLVLAEKIKAEPLDYETHTTTTPPATINTDSTSSSSCSSLGGGGGSGAGSGMMNGGANSGETLLLHNNPLMSSASKRTPTSAGPIGLMMKPNRPSSLAVPFTLTPSQTLAGVRSSDFSGIPISTPSAGIFNFDSLMDGGTGLTPVAGPLVPTSTGAMATHHRNPMELVTPTSEPSKLVSL